MRIFTLLSFLFFGLITIYGQTNYSINEVVPGGKGYKKLQPQLTKYKFSNSGKALFVVDDNSVRFFDLTTSSVGKVLFDLNGINDALASISEPLISKVPSFSWGEENNIYLTLNKKLLLFNYLKKEIEYYYSVDEETSVDFPALGDYFSYTKGNSLIICKSGKRVYSLGDSLSTYISYGSVPYRSEFGLKDGTVWSPSGKYLIFYKVDQTLVNKYPIVDYSVNPPIVQSIPYPMVGAANQLVTVGVLELASGKIKYINNGTLKDIYYTNIVWSPDESSFYVAEVDREQKILQLVQYNTKQPEEGRVVFTENEMKYIEPENGVFFSPKNAKEFIWLSRRDGYNHLYKYNTNGDVLRQLTKGDWEVLSVLGFSDDGKNLIIEANKSGALEQQIYKIDVSKGVISQISKVAGYHKATLSKGGSLLLDEYSNKDVPGITELHQLAKESSRVLSSSYNPLKKGRVPKIDVVNIKAADDSTILYGRIVTPPDMDSKKKYPVIVYVYGGPHSQLVKNKWLSGAPLWDLYMAQKGYIVFTLDNRGTSNRGKEFEQATHLNLGEVEMADQLKGVEYLKKLSYVDKNWIGVFGWSFGGFMSISLMENYPDVFKVGVAGGPVVDWSMYEIMYGERYMSTPELNPEGYEKSNTLTKIDNIEGKLMLIHGTSDDVVLWKHTMNFVQTSVDKGFQLDYFIYPNHEHNVTGPDRVHLMEKITEYFDDYLR